MVSRARASLVVLSNTITSADIEEHLGLVGDRRWDVGEPVRPGSKARQRFAGWEITSRVDRSAPASSHVQDLLGRAYPLADRISALAVAGQIETGRASMFIEERSSHQRHSAKINRA